jgi:uncharacterized protein YfaS (alpha-2-macroglobulin family)
MSRIMLVGLLLLAAPPVAQQSSLRVLQVTPRPAVLPTEAVTITFDRPVVGSLGHVIDPERIASLRPAVPVRFDWRDPSTLRLVPLHPLPSGQVVTLVIDTSLVALDGSRLTAPVRIPIRVSGPAMRGTLPELSPRRTTLPPDGRLRVVYSSEVDTVLLGRIARYTFDPPCRSENVSLRIAVQRRLAPEDAWQLVQRVGYDSVPRASARVVELVPASPLPNGCPGDVVLPSLDSLDATEISYPITSAPAFAFSSLACAASSDCARSESVTLRFTTPVSQDAARRGIRVDGAAAAVVSEPGVGDWTTVRLTLTPRSSHRITFDSTLTDIAGRPLTGAREVSIDVGDRLPRVSHPAGFMVQPRGAPPFLRVTHVNVDSVVAELVPLPSQGAASYNAALGDTRLLWNRPDVIRRSIVLGGLRNEVRTTDVPLNELTASPAPQFLAVRLRLQRGMPGLLPSVMRSGRGRTPFPMTDTMSTAAAVIQVSGLSVHTRMDEARGAVLVTELRRAAPVRGAVVTVRDGVGMALARARTDSSGVAQVADSAEEDRLGALGTEGARPVRFIEVERAGDRLVLPLTFDHRNPLEAGFNRETPLRSWLGPDRRRRAVLFTDRDLYRPGERVYLTAVARDGPVENLHVPRTGERFRWRVSSYGDGGEPRVVFEREAQLTSFGTTADSFDLATSVPLGPNAVELQRQIAGHWSTLSQVMFHVKEYRAPEFALRLTSDSTPRFVGDTVTFAVTGRYLYDAPMRGSLVRWSATISEASPWDLRIPSLPAGFGFGDLPSGVERQYLTYMRWQSLQGTATLDATGRAEIPVPSSGSLVGTKRLSFTLSVEDVNRQFVTTSRDQVLFGSSHYFALRETGSRWWWRVGTPVRIEVLAIRPNGTRAAGEAITARVVHERWVDSSGVGADGRLVPDTVATWPVVSADSAVTLSFTPRGGGYYTLQLTGRDSSGRAVTSHIRRFVVGGAAWLPNDWPATRLAVHADSANHPVGTTAAIRLESPFESADAWVTVEREGLLRQFRRPVRQGPNEIGIPISETMAPGAIVGIVLLNRAPLGAGDSLHRRIRTGLVRLRVDSLVKRLAVTVAPERRELAPATEARMKLRVADYRGRGTPAAVTVWAVDEGVLSMGSYQRPDPVTTLQSQHWRWLASASTLPSQVPLMERRLPAVDLQQRERLQSNMLRIRGANSLSLSEVVTTGVGAAMELHAFAAATSPPEMSASVRQDFRTTAFFRGVALTDGTGNAVITVRLPDNITTYRIFAVAVGADDRAGAAESTFVATRPLVVRAALPRFVRPGDTFLAGAAVGARDGRPRTVQVVTEATGISLAGSATTTLQLSAGNAEARFAWSARESDSARVTLGASDGTDEDAVRVAIPVKPDRFPLTRSFSGVVRDTMTVRIALPRDIDLMRSRLTIRAGTTPLTLIDEARLYLDQYPYACTEQLLASARVLVASLTLQRSGLPVKLDPAKALTTLQSVVDQLARRQRDDGAYGYWSGDSWSTPWLSTSVGLLLLDAADVGARLDDHMKDRLTGYLATSLDSLPVFPDTSAGTRVERRRTAANHLSERLAAAVYFRRIGQARLAEEGALLQRESLLAWEDRVLLARLLSDAGNVPEARQLLDQAWRGVTSAGLRVDLPDSIAGGGLFPSRVRPAARLVEATILINPSHPRLGALMERLVSRTASRAWWNTQDYATAASAIAQFSRVVPIGDAVLTATIGTRDEIALRTTNGAAVDSTIDFSNLATREGDSLVVRLRLTARNGPLFYGVSSHEVSTSPDTRPVMNGVTVERWYERFDNGEPATEVREGELVRVRLRITVPNQRDFLAVEDPLPAGLEAVDLSLRTSGTLGPFSTQASHEATARRDREAAAGGAIGSWDSGWWSPFEHSEKRDDRVTWFARALGTGTYTVTYVARATTAGRFIRPPSRAEEMYNAATNGRSEGGIFVVTSRNP